jgi:chemotaxis protein MotB
VARKSRSKDRVNYERWMVSYADFITLLFATFVALFALSNADKDKFDEMALSLRTAFTANAPTDARVAGLRATETEIGDSPGLPGINLGRGPSTGPSRRPIASSTISGLGAQTSEGDPKIDAPPSFNVTPTPTPPGFDPGRMQSPPDGRRAPDGAGGWIPKLEEELRELVRNERRDEAIEVRRDPRGLVVSLNESIFFEPGKSFVRDESLPRLERIMALIRDRGCPVIVEGHADDRPSIVSAYASQFELTVARVSRLAQFMTERYGIDSKLVSAAGYGSTRPIASNATEVGRRKNRRVDLVIRAPEKEEGAQP